MANDIIDGNASSALDLRDTPLASTQPAPDVGLHGYVLGKYVLEEEIGRGGMGRVYRARHAFLGQSVAIKLCLGLGEGAYRDVMREGRAMAKLHDPHVVRVLDVGMEEGLGPYLVMELLGGRGLDDVLLEGAVAAPRAVALALDLAFGLAAAHGAALVHRDLKPSNVIVETTLRGERAKVLDFGIVKPLHGSDQHPSIKGRVVGTPLYMSPEQWRSDPITPKSDMWSFGVVVFEMLTGQLPFDAPSPWQLCMKVNETIAPRLSAIHPQIDSALDQLVAACLQRAPELRPTAAEAAASLARLQLESPRPITAPRRKTTWVPTVLATAVLGALVVARSAAPSAPRFGAQVALQKSSAAPIASGVDLRSAAPASEPALLPEPALKRAPAVRRLAPWNHAPAALPEEDVLRSKPRTAPAAGESDDPLRRR